MGSVEKLLEADEVNVGESGEDRLLLVQDIFLIPKIIQDFLALLQYCPADLPQPREGGVEVVELVHQLRPLEDVHARKSEVCLGLRHLFSFPKGDDGEGA